MIHARTPYLFFYLNGRRLSPGRAPRRLGVPSLVSGPANGIGIVMACSHGDPRAAHRRGGRAASAEEVFCRTGLSVHGPSDREAPLALTFLAAAVGGAAGDPP